MERKKKRITIFLFLKLSYNNKNKISKKSKGNKFLRNKFLKEARYP